MTELRQAAEMALECLDYHWDNPDSELEDTPYVLEAKQALRQALAQPEQEPVGYAHVEDLKREHHDFWVNRQQGVNEVPLYAAPKREWVGLTDDEIAKYWGDSFAGNTQYVQKFARIIEANLKEKNHD